MRDANETIASLGRTIAARDTQIDELLGRLERLGRCRADLQRREAELAIRCSSLQQRVGLLERELRTLRASP